jgi:hypothetical protein
MVRDLRRKINEKRDSEMKTDEHGADDRTHLVLQCKTLAYHLGSHSGIGRTRPGPGYICNARRVHENESEMMEGHSRLLDALGLDMPARKVILQHAYETFFRFFTQFCTAIKTRNNISNPSRRGNRGTGKKRGQHSMSQNVGSEERKRAACVGG